MTALKSDKWWEDLKGAIPPPPERVWRLTYEARPWTLNVERQGNRWIRGKLVAEWREAFAWLASEIPPQSRIWVIVRPELRSGAGIPDTGACIGAAKAAIDGLVDAGVIVDDSPQYVKRLVFEAPVISGIDALSLDVYRWLV